tara:strand:- start:2113 stop:2619 length:507 start_codon:yes stop_codon:yes gene_type:complete
MTASKPLPSLPLLEEHFKYNPDTGLVRNKHTGNIIQRLDSKGKYIQVDFLNEVWQLHRFCYYLGTKKNPGLLQVDHRDQDKTNNKLSNLRLLSNAEQQLNTKLRSDSKSGYKGVIFDKKGNKWRAYITFEKKKIFVYRGDSLDEAIAARKAAERKYYPHLFPDPPDEV